MSKINEYNKLMKKANDCFNNDSNLIKCIGKKRVLQSIDAEIKNTYSDTDDDESREWESELDDLKMKIKKDKKLDKGDNTTILQCLENEEYRF